MEHSTNKITAPKTTSTQGADGAGGVPKRQWYVAIVNNRAEQRTAQIMSSPDLHGAYECYVPIQRETHKWKNGKKKIIDRIVLPTLLFVRCTEAQRLQSLRLHLVNRYMMDRTRTDREKDRYKVATIPDRQLQQFRDMLTHADTPVTIESAPYHLGDKVKVISGPFTGITGHITGISGPLIGHHQQDPAPNTYLILHLPNIGYAKVQIHPSQVEKLEE